MLFFSFSFLETVFITTVDTDVLLMGSVYCLVVVGSMGLFYCPINIVFRFLRM